MRSIIFVLVVATLLSSGLVRADKKITLSLKIIDTVPSIEISDAALSDGVLNCSINAFRGDTLKRTVYIKAVDQDNRTISQVEKMSLSKKFDSSSQSFTLNLRSCDEKVFLLVYGLGIEKRQVFECPKEHLSGDSSSAFLESSDEPGLSEGSVSSSDAGVSYNISFPQEVRPLEGFNVRVIFSNPTDRFFDIDAWAYVYRSSKCYSGGREDNRKTVSIPEHSNITFNLPIIVEASPGEYSLKFKLLLPDRKLPKDLTEKIVVLEEEVGPKNTTVSFERKDLMTGDAVKDVEAELPKSFDSDAYLSTSAKTKKILPFLLILALSLILSLVVFKVL